MQVAGIAHLGRHLLVANVAAIGPGPDADLVGLHQLLAVADVEGLHVLQHDLHGVGQGFVGQIHIGEQRVAAGIGRFLCVEDGRRRRLGVEHLVGVPDLAEGLRVTLFLDDFEDIGVVVHALHERVVVDFPETLGKGDLLLGRNGLAAEEDYKMLEPGGLYLLECLIVHAAQVDG